MEQITLPTCQMGTKYGDFSLYGGGAAEGFFSQWEEKDGYFNGRLKDEAVEGLFFAVFQRQSHFHPRLQAYVCHDESRGVKWQGFVSRLSQENRRLLLQLLAMAVKNRPRQKALLRVLSLRRDRPFFDDDPDPGLYALTVICNKIDWGIGT